MKRKILLVANKQPILKSVTGVLSPMFEVYAIADGFTALSVAEDYLPDLVLLDVDLGDVTGFDVCRQLKLHPRLFMTPVVFLTDTLADSILLECFNVGGLACVPIQCNPDVLRAYMQTHVGNAHSLRYLEAEVQRKTQELHSTRLEIIRKLGKASEFKDNETGMHIERIARYAYCLAKAYGLSEDACVLLKQASPMHDIGKIGIPDGILLKAGKLDSTEWELMKRHTTLGADLIGDSDIDIFKAAKIVAIQHHEKWDGTGYPNGVSGTEIHIFARIVAIADVFDALTTERPYKKPWKFDEALSEIQRSSGKHFDPEVVDCFMRALPQIKDICAKYKDGTLATLTTSLY